MKTRMTIEEQRGFLTRNIAYEDPDAAVRDIVNCLSTQSEAFLVPILTGDRTDRPNLDGPFRKILDLRLYFRFLTGYNDDSIMTCGCAAEFLEPFLYGVNNGNVDLAKMERVSIGNLNKFFPWMIRSIGDLIKEFHPQGNIMDLPGMPCIQVLTNQGNWSGASLLLCREAMDALCDACETDSVWAFPSSVEEIIAIPSWSITAEEASAMVGAVNTEQVSPKDRVTDHAYLYNRQNGTLYVAGQYDHGYRLL